MHSRPAAVVLARFARLLAFSSFVFATTPCLAQRCPEKYIGVPADGDRFCGRLRGIDASWQLHFLHNEERRRMPASDLAWWGRRCEPTRGTRILLSDNSLLVADVVALDERTLEIDGELWGQVRVPRPLVQGIVWRLPFSPLDSDRLLDRIRSFPANSDQLILRNGDSVEGRLRRINNREMEFEAGVSAGKLDVAADQVVAWIPQGSVGPRHQGRPAFAVAVSSPLRMLVGLRDGSLLVAETATLKAQLKLRLTCGVELVSDGLVQPIEEGSITLLQPLGGRVTYLSDLEPLGYKHIPFLDVEGSWGADRNAGGGQLRVGGILYSKGLGMRSTSRLAFGLARPSARFEADLAIDDAAQLGGSVVFRVFVTEDGTSWHEAYQSHVVRGGDRPHPISVDIAAARALALVVDFADRGDELDQADWLNARVR